jgi:hypothetical protein
MSLVKKIRAIKQGDSKCKTAWALFHFFAKLRDQMCTMKKSGVNVAEQGKPRCVNRGLPQRKLTFFKSWA